MNEDIRKEAPAEENAVSVQPGAENEKYEEEVDIGELIKENALMKKRLECAEHGVRKECIDDVIAIADNSGTDIREVIEKYPMFASAAEKPYSRTGVCMSRKRTASDDSTLRKAFGLKD
jgi:hypothetical protein